MQLSEFQVGALAQIVKAYESTKTSVLLIMPPGTGKTTLSKFVVKEFSKKFGIKSFGYFSSSSALKGHFETFINDGSTQSNSTTKVYTYRELADLIDSRSINQDEFEVLIFDDIDDAGFYVGMTNKIYSYFKGFKIGFSRSALNPETKSVFKVEDGGIIFFTA